MLSMEEMAKKRRTAKIAELQKTREAILARQSKDAQETKQHAAQVAELDKELEALVNPPVLHAKPDKHESHAKPVHHHKPPPLTGHHHESA